MNKQQNTSTNGKSKMKCEVERMSKERVEYLSERFVSVSNGILTKRQTMAYLLLELKELDAEEVADYMDINVSTVYTLSSKGREKFVGVASVHEQFDGLSWYMRIGRTDKEGDE